jgi:hypothetical protein
LFILSSLLKNCVHPGSGVVLRTQARKVFEYCSTRFLFLR